MKRNKGITLIALIITVILMLILAGVAISVLTDDGGLYDKTSMATKEYKKESMIEVVKNAELQLKLDTIIDKSLDFNITNLIEKIKEISEINDTDYIITVNEEEQSAVIIDKATGIIIEIWIDENDNVIIEGSIVDDITNTIAPTIELSLDPEEGTYSEAVKIIVTVKEKTNGITKLQFPDNSEKTYSNDKTVTEEYTVNKNGTYKFTAEGGNGRTASKSINVKNAMLAGDIQLTLQNAEPTNQSVVVKAVYDENIKGMTNADKYQYRIGNGSWQTATATQDITVSDNETVYARYFDGVNGHKTVSLAVVNIDKGLPNTFNLSAIRTTDSITVTGSTTDTGSEGTAPANIGISGYQFQLKASNGSTLVEWTAKRASGSYTFNNLTQNTEYKVSMKAIDKAGNERNATNNDYSIRTEALLPAEGNVTITATPTTATNGSVKVVMQTGLTGYTLQYKIGEGEWTEYTEGETGFEVSTNGAIHARLLNGSGQAGETKTINITNIDKGLPNEFNLSVTKTETTITVTGNTTDTGSEGTAGEYVGISGYQFQLKDNAGEIVTDWTAKQGEGSYTFSGLTTDATYKVNMKAIDNAGNERAASNNELSVVPIIPVYDENKTYNGQSEGTFDNPIIPKGFKPINENDAIWGTEDGYQKGLVIQDENGNEFVWVPVDGTTIKFARYNWGKNYGSYSNYTETVPTTITTSVNKNGGFYIGRYEAGKSGTTVVSKKGATVWNSINWSNANTNANGMYASNNTNYGATSTLIYGTQWDTALKFIGAYGGDTAYATNSEGKGNYQGTSGGDTTTAAPATCGFLEAFRQKNIYDMAGNVYEWTVEPYDASRHVLRGGSYSSSGSNVPAGFRYGGYYPNVSLVDIAFRVALYIK